jgi:dGTPase
VDLLERRYPEFPGLNLTYEVREGFATHSARHAFGREESEFADDRQPTLEAQIVAVADEIAYDNHDLDDGLASGILEEREVTGLELWQCAAGRPGADLAACEPPVRRAQIIRRLIDLTVGDVIAETRRRLAAAGIETLAEVRRHETPLVALSGDLAAPKAELETFLRERFYDHYTVRRMTSKAQRFLTDLFGAYAQDVRMLPPEHQAAAAARGVERGVCDYLAGLTDRAAQQEHRQLFQPFERT